MMAHNVTWFPYLLPIIRNKSAGRECVGGHKYKLILLISL